jgi:uncharacterized Tic20 family protein
MPGAPAALFRSCFSEEKAMTDYPAVDTTSEERTLAAIAHVFGFVVALIIYLTQKDKSRFLRFQAMQAVAFDVAVFVVVFAAIGCLMAFLLLGGLLGTAGFAASAAAPEEASGALGAFFLSLTIIIPIAANCIVFALVLAVLVLRVVAAVNVYQGRNYHHPFIGDRVEMMVR